MNIALLPGLLQFGNEALQFGNGVLQFGNEALQFGNGALQFGNEALQLGMRLSSLGMRLSSLGKSLFRFGNGVSVQGCFWSVNYNLYALTNLGISIELFSRKVFDESHTTQHLNTTRSNMVGHLVKDVISKWEAEEDDCSGLGMKERHQVSHDIMHTHTRTHTHAHTRTHTHTCTRTHAHTRTRTRTHARMHARTHTHTSEV